METIVNEAHTHVCTAYQVREIVYQIREINTIIDQAQKHELLLMKIEIKMEFGIKQ